MGIILAKFRKEKSTQEILEALQEKIETLETFTVNTQEQKKRIVSNFLGISIGVYVIAFIAFYFVYFPPTWQEKIMYCIPLLLFPIIIMQLRYLFTWYFQRKLNKNSKKLTALRAEKKKILEQVMDKETYKVAVNLLARFADKPSKPAITLTSSTPGKSNEASHNRSLPTQSNIPKSNQLVLTSTPQTRLSTTTASGVAISTPLLTTQVNTPRATTLVPQRTGGVVTQQLRRRTPFPIFNQQEKSVFDRIVDVLIGDGPQDRFAMICKDCYSHNGMALKEDFEYTTFRCAFCNALNPARKSRPAAPRLTILPAPKQNDSDTSDSEDEKEDSDDECPRASPNTTAAPVSTLNSFAAADTNNDVAEQPSTSLSSSHGYEEEKQKSKNTVEVKEKLEETKELSDSVDELIKELKKSDSAIEE